MENIEQIRAMIKAIPATPQGDKQIEMLVNGSDPMKRMLAAIEANNRARARQQQKAMQGQQQQGRPPVVQEKLAELVQSGLGGLEVSPEMFNEGAYAAGGIVAFEDGGEVRHFDGEDGSYVTSNRWSAMGPGTSRFLTDEERLARYIASINPRTAADIRRGGAAERPAAGSAAAVRAGQARQTPTWTFDPTAADREDAAIGAALRANTPAPAANPAKANPAKANAANAPVAGASAAKTNVVEEKDPFSIYEAYLKGDAAERAAARKEARDMSMFEAGLNILGGESPYAAVNIGQGGAKGAKSYQERIGALRKEDRDIGKSLAELGLEKEKLKQSRDLAELNRKSAEKIAGIYSASRGDADEKTRANIIKGVTASVDKALGKDPNYYKLKTAAERAQYRQKLIQDELGLYNVDNAAGSTWAGWSGSPVKPSK